MTLNNTSLLIFLSSIFAFTSCKKSDSGPGVPPGPGFSITAISPASGLSATLDTITGKGFTALDSVFFNGKGATVVSTSATQLVVKVPPQAGTGKVTITAGGNSVTGPVFTFTGNTYLVSTFAGSGTASSIDGTGTAASFAQPYSIAIDHDNNLYVVDFNSNEIRKVTPAGVVTTFAGNGTAGSVDNVTGTLASFNQPSGVAVDGSGNLYIADFFNDKIRKISPAGAVSTFAGSGSPGTKDATGTAAQFFHPTAVAVNGNGNIFVADAGNFTIRKITPTGGVSTFAGNSASFGSADGKGPTASFSEVDGIVWDAAAGNLYVADEGNNIIRKITPDSTVTTIAGMVGIAGHADGTGLSASFDRPYSIAVDANGFMYVADLNNDVIRQITPSAQVTLLAGIVNTTGSNDGPALQAKFNTPTSIVIDSHGNIFVADAGNNTIRKLTPQ